MKSKIIASVLAVIGLAGTGRVVAPLGQDVWLRMAERSAGVVFEPTLAGVGSGMSLALLGGFRGLAADVSWLQVYASWEKRDIAATDSLIRLTTTIDPRPVYFWLNGARMLAYDFSAWRLRMAGGHDNVAEATRREIDRDQGQQALGYLRAALRWHQASPDLWIEQANIQLNRLRDPSAAAESYLRAWELPKGPYYAARLHAEMLRRAGRLPEALAFLKKLHPKLPKDDEAAAADVVLARIRAMEKQLQVDPRDTYQPLP